MRVSKQISIEFPDDGGMIGRECPRCQGRFTVDRERYEDSGFRNLRCPYCGFIAELDRFMTGEQRGYAHSVQQGELYDLAEEMLEEALSDIGFESTGGIDFGGTPTESPQFSTETELVECGECGFCFGTEVGREGVCPVCR
ncbi:hypothetical protein GRX01_01620 [Halobaculum sp. WSA2]|uniref:Uncharacterized protein n=1 Tax=Halobaculum saliterrae TaxID=2073113 RepID=A0A6B0T0C1_9EURY|nr:hypothetical protein [Halobaculum saliterrae]MXR40059.1 hypothetical protein [Halobaculum saliterrae]